MAQWLSIDTEYEKEPIQYLFNNLKRIGDTFISYNNGGKKIYIKITNDAYNELYSLWGNRFPFYISVLASKPKISDYDILEDMSSDDVYDIDNDFKNERIIKKLDKEISEISDWRNNPLRKIARENNISQPKFLQFMVKRFPNNSDLNYADEWAKRIRNKTAYKYGDSKTRDALKKNGL